MYRRRETAATGVRGSSMKDRDRDLFFRAAVSQRCVTLDMKKLELAALAGMSKSTFYAKMRNPGMFSVTEMRDICNILKFSVEDKTSIL